MKKFIMDIKNDDYIVRDHHVHGVRIMPGVTFLDIMLRILGKKGFPIERTEFSNILFSEAISTTDAYDKKIAIGLQIEGDKGEIVGRSQKIEGEKTLETSWSENVRCQVSFNNDIIKKHRDIEALKRNAKKKIDLEEMYSYVRSIKISHYEFMKGLGVVYVGEGYLLAELHLSGLAEEYLDFFYAHPAFLDCSTLIPLTLFMLQGKDKEPTPYIPLFIEKFRSFKRIGGKCYVYVEPNADISEADDIIYNDMELYDEAGDIVASFERLAAKRIRSEELITKLREVGAAKPDKRSTDGRGLKKRSARRSKAKRVRQGKPQSVKEMIEGDLRSNIAEILGKRANDIDVCTGFYDLGLDSTQLLQIVRGIESKLGEQLYPTLLFEYTNVRDLAEYFNSEYGDRYVLKVGTTVDDVDDLADESDRVDLGPDDNGSLREDSHEAKLPVIGALPSSVQQGDEVAIVGLSGRYPKANSMLEFWKIVHDGKDCISEVPLNHWDYRQYYNSEYIAGEGVVSKWGGFIDDVDAKLLCKLLRIDELPEAVHMASDECRELRGLLAARRQLINARTKLCNMVRGVVRQEGVRLVARELNTYKGWNGLLEREWKLSHIEVILRTYYRSYCELTKSIQEIDRDLGNREKRDERVEKLKTIPGVGKTASQTLLSAIDTIDRFSTSKKLVSYSGLAPSVRSSGDRTVYGAITREGRREVRGVWCQIAHLVAHSEKPAAAPLRAWFERVAKRRGKRTAVVALTRKLLTIAFCMLRDNASYDPGRLGLAAASG